MAFLGAKGGVGTTTLAANYALALQQESKDDVCLVDLNTQLGDAALSLGLEPKFSLVDALESASRLDYELRTSAFRELEYLVRGVAVGRVYCMGDSALSSDLETCL